MTKYANIGQIAKDHLNWAIRCPIDWGYGTLHRIVHRLDLYFSVWSFDGDKPEEVGVIPYSVIAAHIDNEFSNSRLLRSYGPNAKTPLLPRAMWMVSHTHKEYGFNPDSHFLPLPEGITPEMLTVGARFIARFTDRLDREALVTRAAPPGRVGDAPMPLRALVEHEDTLVEMTVDYRQVVRYIGRLELPVSI